MIPHEERNARLRAETRERQVLSLRARRHEVTPKERRLLGIIRRGFGELDRLETRGVPMTRAQVAVSLGLSREAVRLIEARALAKLRVALCAEDLV